MSDSNARPVEIHFRGLSSVDRLALPLLSSMVYGELYAAEMLNARGLGVSLPGIFCGYIPKVKNGLTFTISMDVDRGYSAGLIEIGLQQFHIVQQHDIDITVETGYKWIVVLEAFYEQGVATTQVSSDATVDAASVRAIRDYELNDTHQIICEIDLTSGKTSIDISDFDITRRNDRVVAIGDHVAEDNPHPQYIKKSDVKFNELAQSSDLIALESLNIVTDTHEQTLPAADNGSWFDVQVAVDVDLDAGDVRFNAPAGEKINALNGKHDNVRIVKKEQVFKFYRLNGEWYAS